MWYNCFIKYAQGGFIMALQFSLQDLERLEALSEKQLYILNSNLVNTVSAVKSSCLVSTELVCQLVVLAETAAHEVSCRKRWWPKVTDGIYSTTNISYDTESYNQWLRRYNENCTVRNKDMAFLEQFSFWNDILSVRASL